MLLFIVCYAASAGVGELIVRRYPRKLAVLFSFPLLMIVSLLAAFGYYAVLQYTPLEGSFRVVASAAVTATITMWFSVGRILQGANIGKLAQRPKDDEKKDEVADILNPISSAPELVTPTSAAANLALEYRSDLARELELVRPLGHNWEVQFLGAVEQDPKADPANIIRAIEVQLKEIYPFRDEEIHALHTSLERLGAMAAREFRSTLWVLGDTVIAADVADKISERARRIELESDLTPGVYIAGKMKFRVRPDRQISLISGPSGEELQGVYVSFEELRSAYIGVEHLSKPTRLP